MENNRENARRDILGPVDCGSAGGEAGRLVYSGGGPGRSVLDEKHVG